jgi:hypothetical protein
MIGGSIAMYEAKSFRVTQHAWIVARYRLSYMDMNTGATMYTSDSQDVLLDQQFERSAQEWGVPDGAICTPQIREVPTGGWVPADYAFKAVYNSQQAAPYRSDGTVFSYSITAEWPATSGAAYEAIRRQFVESCRK